jgi:lipoate-protein ligase A
MSAMQRHKAGSAPGRHHDATRPGPWATATKHMDRSSGRSGTYSLGAISEPRASIRVNRPTDGSPWSRETREGTAALLHEWDPPGAPSTVVRELVIDGPALALGSSQPDDHVDHLAAKRHGIDVVRRHSGGGAVLLLPGEHRWLDFWLPAGDPLWSDDVVKASGWLGDVWAECLAPHIDTELTVHRGPLESSPWSAAICFAGRGPGEVFAGSKKLVGVSQRRTREWARFQTMLHHEWRADLTQELTASAFTNLPSTPLPDVAVAPMVDVVGALMAQLRRSDTTA